jgi:type III secretion system needle length determinant
MKILSTDLSTKAKKDMENLGTTFLSKEQRENLEETAKGFSSLLESSPDQPESSESLPSDDRASELSEEGKQGKESVSEGKHFSLLYGNGRDNPLNGEKTSSVEMVDKGLFTEPFPPEDTASKSPVPKQEENLQDVVGEAIQQMSLYSPMLLSSSSVAASEPRQDSAAVSEAVRKVVERILVEVPGSSHKQEVRIVLSSDVLLDTEIRLVRDEGRLHITFVTGSEDANRLLSPNLSSLREQLENRYGQDTVALSVQMKEENQRENNEGRSRQQRNIWEEYEG